jgi:hypothetical protein
LGEFRSARSYRVQPVFHERTTDEIQGLVQLNVLTAMD